MRSFGSRWSVVGIILLVGALLSRSTRTPAPVDASAPAEQFSSGRALVHVRAIAERPHPSGSIDHARVREYLLAQLRALGLDPQVQEATAVGTRSPTAGHVLNVLARLPGRVPRGPALLIATHYDGVPAGPAAGDDAAGSAALLETLRALRAGAPLEHDVIALFTDGEEIGLLGAAAFVQEHPWARDVAVTTNWEARGTAGRSNMFETGAGNLDAVRVLSTVGDVTAGSLSVTVYRMLPNDTDLSEIALLGRPALNFAFIEGVERYHTTHDDVAHLSEGSLQHHGVQMLALARAFGNGPLPRPVTADAVFFDAPFLGIVSYPESWSVTLAIAAALLLLALVLALRREASWLRGLGLGVVGMLAATGFSAFTAARLGTAITKLHASTGWDGAPEWRSVYAAAIAFLALAVSTAAWALMRRWSSAAALHTGALVVWGVLAVATAMRLPGVSFLFAWPLVAATLAALVSQRAPDAPAAVAATWLATIVATSLVVPVIHMTGAYALPLDGPGAIAIGALVPMLAWLIAPIVETAAGERRFRAAGLVLAASLALLVVGMARVRRSADHPTPANLTYVTSTDADSAWLVAPLRALRDGAFSTAALGPSPRILKGSSDTAFTWVRAALSSSGDFALRPAPRTISDAPAVTIVTDSVVGDQRRLSLRFTAPTGTWILAASGEPFVKLLAIDGRTVDGTRYRNRPRGLSITFAAPPDSGFTARIALPVDSALALRVRAVSAGLPDAVARDVPARPDGVVHSQSGDVTVRYRQVTLPRSTPPLLNRP